MKRFFRFLRFWVAAVLIMEAAVAAEVHANTYLLSPTDDSWVYSYSPHANYGTETGIATAIQFMSPRGFAFLKFSIPALNGEDIQSATLHLYQFDGAGYGQGMTAVGLFSNNNWSEKTITWNNIADTGSFKILATNSNGHSHVGWSSWSFPWNSLYGNTVSLYVAENSSGDQSHWWYSKEYQENKKLRPYLELTTAAPTLYFPHIDTYPPWQTEIAVINTSNQAVTGTLKGLSNAGQQVETKTVILPARGRRQIIVADEFTNHKDIGYIIFNAGADTVQGYTKFYQAGAFRTAIPAEKEINTSDIYISHIDSGNQWWTGVSLVNTTSATKALTITFNTGQSAAFTLNAKEHKAFTIASLFNNQPQPDIKSAVITNASGIIGLELFGSSNQLDGIPLNGNTATTIYYPHVDNDGWWTGIAAYNPSALACTITITPYSAQGELLTPVTLPLAGKGKYIGVAAALGLPDRTAWFKIDSTRPLSGFELFGTANDQQLAAYAGGGGTGAKAGVFPKIEKNGWTGIAFINTEASAASVSLTAYNDNGAAVAVSALTVAAHAKVVNLAEAIFVQNISGATYIAYSSDKNVVGFQLNGSADGTMLDGLPGL